MSASTRKDRCFGLAMHPTPFTGAQLFPNDLLAGYMALSGTSGQPPPGVWFKFECEILRDEQVKKVITGAKDIGFPDNASLFTADVTTRVDVASSSPSPKARAHASFVAKIPKDIPVDEFHAKLEAAVDSFVELPVCQKNILKHTYVRRPIADALRHSMLTLLPQWRQNTNIAGEARTLNYPEAEQVVVLLHEHETLNDLVKAGRLQITQDAAYRKLMAEQRQINSPRLRPKTKLEMRLGNLHIWISVDGVELFEFAVEYSASVDDLSAEYSIAYSAKGAPSTVTKAERCPSCIRRVVSF
ncbi:hypothetical protein K438DRAFT_1772128 [Mycena galopus ATCC 62051]|nr:hypothetical protein K438DRAFT_1772128 [Mycena galopus ATCC 62051]